MGDMQASKPAGQSGPGNDTMRWSECTGPAHPRLAVCTWPARLSHCVDTCAHRFPVFGRGLLQEGLHTVMLAQLYSIPSTVLPIAPDPASDPASEPWKTRFGKEMLPRFADQAHFWKGSVLDAYHQHHNAHCAVPFCRSRTTPCFTPQLHPRTETCARQEPAWPALFSPIYGALSYCVATRMGATRDAHTHLTT